MRFLVCWKLKTAVKFSSINWNEDSEFVNLLHKGSGASENIKKVLADLFEITVIQDSP